jgi:hypothetical protein
VRGRFPLDLFAVAAFVVGGLLLATRAWLADHPQHNPWAPLDLRDPPGWATRNKLVALRENPVEMPRGARAQRRGVRDTPRGG